MFVGDQQGILTMRDGSSYFVVYALMISWTCGYISVFTSAQTLLSPSPSFECAVEDDRCTLLQFKQGLTDYGGEILRSWNDSSAPSSWAGVTWRFRDGFMFVEKLELNGCNLQGSLYPLLHRGLLLISELDLSLNNLSGPLPPTFKVCSRLTSLNLSGNHLEGLLPKDVQCEESLDSSSEILTGPALNLRMISFAGNKLSGRIPGSFITRLPALRVLDLSSNNFTGDIPAEFNQLVHLTHLLLQDNDLSGSIPDSLSNCKGLVSLRLGYNNFSGTIPLNTFGNLPELETLDISFNQFTGDLRMLPDRGHFMKLKELLLGGNFLNGSVPEELSKLTSLEVLELRSNNFSGQVPSSLGNLLSLKSLSFQRNSLMGSIPAELGQLSSLITLNLGWNYLSGVIPSSLGNCSNLRSLWLSDNNLEGSIPNELYGFQDLVVFSLYGNRLTETISPEVANLSKLVVFDLSWNSLRGQMPEEVCELRKLRILLLNNNYNLSGPLPLCTWNFPDLQIADMSYNAFSGRIPGNFSGLSYLKVVNRTNKLPVPEELRSTQFGQKIMDLNLTWKTEESPTLIFLSNNKFSGPIPPGLGELQKLQELDLSFNELSGMIPGALGNATSLFLLNLASNELTGAIPFELTNLTFLAWFNVSNNQLGGPIPQGRQFSTFSDKSFAGNLGLCGFPTSIECSEIEAAPFSDDVARVTSKDKLDRKYLLLLIIGSSALAAFVIFVGIVLFTCVRRFRRRKSSSLVSHSYDFFDSSDDQQFYQVNISSMLPSLTPKELAQATDYYNDNNIIGDGGFGLVYKAVLNNGSVVAVKRLVDGMQGHSEFLAEMRTLGKLKHKNLVCLLGYCSHGGERILVYEYLKHGSLDNWLYCTDGSNPSLDWRTRLRIARSAAEGLAFLHHDCAPAIIHRDIKVSNILLDDEFEARLADFGLARSAKACESHVSTGLAGTAGYIPPEYSQGSSATVRGDVYSFGVVMLGVNHEQETHGSSLQEEGYGASG